MSRIRIAGLCVAALLALAGLTAASASASTPAWYDCAKAAKGTGDYSNKTCTAATEPGKGKYALKPGIGKGKAFKGTGKQSVLHVKTWLGDNTLSCTASSDSGKPAVPNLEKEVTVTFTGCEALSKQCNTTGQKAGEIKLSGLKGEFGYLDEAPVKVGIKLESEAHPGPTGEIAQLTCGKGIELTVVGGVIGEQLGDVNTMSKASEVVFTAGEYIGEHTFEEYKYVPLVNPPAFADEQAAFEQELKEDLAGEIAKLERPIIKVIICGELIEGLLKVKCTPEAYSGLDGAQSSKGETLEVKA